MNRLLYASACAVALLAGTSAEAHEQCSNRFGVTTCKLSASLLAPGEQVVREFRPNSRALPSFTLVVERVIPETCEIPGDPACEQCVWRLDIEGRDPRIIGELSLGDARLDGQGVVQFNENGELLIVDETLVNFRTQVECWIGMSVRYTNDFHKLFP